MVLTCDEAMLERLCVARRVIRLELFGSWARDAGRTDSDVDLLVDYEPSNKTTLWEHWDFEEELSTVFGGRDVELVSRDALSPFIQVEVTASAKVVYER